MNPDDIDPVIHEAVETVTNRFGVEGLTTMIGLAEERLAVARAAADELATLSSGPVVPERHDGV
jgi:hypothetical protein